MILSIATQKGGTGKTTSAVIISTGLAQLFDKKVLLIDMDPQANASDIFVPELEELSTEETIFPTISKGTALKIRHTKLANMQIVPADLSLSAVEEKFENAHVIPKMIRLKKALENVESDYDYIIIDCPPSLNILMTNALVASDYIIIPTSPGLFSLKGLKELNDTIEIIKAYHNSNLEVMGYLFTMWMPTTASKNTLDLLKIEASDKLFQAVIPRATVIEQAEQTLKTIWEFAPKSPVALAYRKLILEIKKYE